MEVGRVLARRMNPGQIDHVQHISALQWVTNTGTLEWSSRAVMVDKISRSAPGTFFVNVEGHKAPLYVVEANGSAWVQTEPDATKIDNLLRLPLG